MNSWLLAAAGLSAATCGIHVFLGGPQFARPLLAADGLTVPVKFTNYYCWHLVTLAIFGMAVAFWWAAAAPEAVALGQFATFGALAFGTWSLGMSAWFRLSPFQFPQWIFFLPIGALGFLGSIA